MTKQQLGANLRRHRKLASRTLMNVATELGITWQYLGQIERGVNALPVTLVEPLARAYAISPRVLMAYLQEYQRDKLAAEFKAGQADRQSIEKLK